MFAGSPEISEELQHDLTDPANELLFNDVSAWEIVIKHAIGKLSLPSPPDKFVPEMVTGHGMARLPISQKAIFEWGKLPLIHRDPFDRFLIAQANREGCSLVSADPDVKKYQVGIHWK